MNEQLCERGLKELGAAIVEQAVSDWRHRGTALPDDCGHSGGKLRMNTVRDAEDFIFVGDRLPRCISVFNLKLDPDAIREALK